LHYKIGGTYSKQALAILNYSPELLEDAKTDLAARGGTDGIR
jgi:hypothetical protein